MDIEIQEKDEPVLASPSILKDRSPCSPKRIYPRLLDDAEGRTSASSSRGRTFSETDRFSISNRADDSEDVQFDYWYPSWETWKFRRTLSYWVAIMFIEGSMLFVIGGAFSMTSIPSMNDGNMQALVITPYWVGSICFTFGAFAGVLEVVNVPHKDD